MAVNKLTDIDRYGKEGRIDEEYHAPEIAPFEQKEHLRWWLGDSDSRDQMAMYRQEKVGVFWNEKDDQPEQVVDRENWTESFIQWSPQGTYLTSMHAQGVQLWGGKAWSRQKRFAHPGVNLVDYSPKEQYLVTWSHRPLQVDENHPVPSLSLDDDGKNYIIWDLATGKPLRSFATIDVPGGVDEDGQPVKKKLQWPTFKWSSDDKYVARMTQGHSISIYELPHMTLLDKTSIKIEGVMDFEWAPAAPKREGIKTYEQLFCYWTPELGSNPAKVGLMTVPSKEIVRTRNLFNVSDAKLHWQSEAAYVCVKVDRHSKSKKSLATNLEIFRVREKGVPVEVVDSIKDTVINFAWEPKGNRFVLITTGEAIQGAAVGPKTAVSFFAPEKLKGGAPGNFRHIRTVDKKNSNAIYWSPKGRFVVVAALQSQQSFELEFWDMSFDKPKEESEKGDKELNANLQLMDTSEHYGVTDIEWDPTGRYVATVASAFRHRVRLFPVISNDAVLTTLRWKTVTTSTTSKAHSSAKKPLKASSNYSGVHAPLPSSPKKSKPRFARTCATTPRCLTSRMSPRRAAPTRPSSRRAARCSKSGAGGARRLLSVCKKRVPISSWRRSRERRPVRRMMDIKRRLKRLSRRLLMRRRSLCSRWLARCRVVYE
jgi:translation initiation factor 3 subunit B